jgi:hypothetical protein
MFGYENPIPELTKEPLDIFREIDDHDPPFFEKINKENKHNLPEYLPLSLKKAIKSFILTCAIRRIRGHENKHNSMLIHVALLVKWIDRVAYLVNEKTREYENAINSEDKILLKELKELYETDFLPTTKNVLENLDYKDIRIKQHTWEEVKQELKKAVSKIHVRSVHGTRSTTNLEYHNIEEIDYIRHEEKGMGLSVIAIGGNRLSRGITLEGLSISYYIRTTRMYDSLMQMGRWFGYRPGYVDLCRLYTTCQIFEWFNHITMATEEMRNDFDEMTITHQRPKDFRLKVRNHHGLLTITSVAKLNFTEKIEISFSGTNPQTYKLLKTKNAIENNFNALKKMITSLGFPKKENRKEIKGRVRHLFYPNININLLCDFIEDYKIEQPSISNATLSEYIKIQAIKNTITEWSICIVSNTDKRVFIDYNGKTPPKEREPNEDVATFKLEHNNEVITMRRSVRNQQVSRNTDVYLISKNQIDQTGDRDVDLSVKKGGYSQIKEQRKIEKKGLLLIYALDERGTFFEEKYDIPIIGYSLHFPKIDNEEKVSYTATKIYQNFDEEIMEDDDNLETL